MKDDFRRQRERMVREQLMLRGIHHQRVLEAMAATPRELFVPEWLRARAYADSALAIGESQTISQPYMVAVMLELLELKGGEKVLEVGTGSGYQAALLSKLCRQVITVERIESLQVAAQKRLLDLGCTNVSMRLGDGSGGFPAEAPFQAIIVSAAARSVPQPLCDQLDVGGRLIIPVGEFHHQRLHMMRKTASGLEKEISIGCVFVPLVGQSGVEGGF